MAEVLGAVASGLTIAALLKICIESFDLIQAAQKQESEYHRLILRLTIERCRLYAWGVNVGLLDADGERTSYNFDGHHFRPVVLHSLTAVRELFTDSDKITNRYGCAAYYTAVEPGEDVIRAGAVAGRAVGSTDRRLLSTAKENLIVAFSSFGGKSKNGGRRDPLSPSSPTATTTSSANKARWVIRDRQKFSALITEVKSLVDGLQAITVPIGSVKEQAKFTRSRIRRITDLETLDMVSDVCEADYPALAEEAANTSEIVSGFHAARTEGVDVERWNTDVETETATGVEDEIENMSLTELKHRVLELTSAQASVEPGQQATAAASLSSSPPLKRVRTDATLDWKPRFYFFYGFTRDADALKTQLRLRERPHLYPAQLHGHSVAMWGSWRCLLQGPAQAVVDGVAYLVESIEHERILVNGETDEYRSERCSIKIIDNFTIREVEAWTFKFYGTTKDLTDVLPGASPFKDKTED